MENTTAPCPNCRRPLTNHRPWCATYETASDAAQAGDIVEHPIFGPTELVSVYSRQDAIDDGVLVDCSADVFDELNRNAGLIFDVAMTRAVFERYVEVPKAFVGAQDLRGRYWDIVWMFRLAAKKNSNGHELLFDFISIPNGGDTWTNESATESVEQRLVELKAVAGPGDRGEPCLTFMLPSED